MKNIGQPETLREVSDRLWTLEPGDLPRWGTMSVGQMVRHLRLACDVPLGDMAVTPFKGRAQKVVKFFALKTNMRWPPNVKTTPELKRAIEQMQPQESLDQDVKATVARLERIAGGAPCLDSHPIFGRMTHADWMRWGYLHADHHLRQFGR